MRTNLFLLMLILSWFSGCLAFAAEVSSLPAASSAQETVPPIVSLQEPMTLKGLLSKTQDYPIDLSTVLQLASDQNILIAEDQVNAKISHSLLRQSQISILPNIEGTYTQSHLEGGIQIAGGQTTQVVRNTVQPQLSANWTVYPGGRTLYEILAAKRRETGAKLQVNQTYQEQLSGAAQDYYKLLAAELQREVVLTSLAETQRQVELNQARLDVGIGNKLEVTQAKTLVSQQQLLLIQAENAIATAEQALINRLNLDFHLHLVPSNAEKTQRPLVSSVKTVDELIDMALKQNPALQKTDAELKALGIDYKAIRSDFIPSVTLRTYINGTGPDWQSLSKNTFGGLTVNMNLLQNLGLQIPYRLQEKKGEINRQILMRKALVNDIQSQVMQAFLNSRSYQSSIEASQQAQTQSEESLEVALARFKAGFGTNLDIINAEVALTSARSNLAQAVLNYNQSQVQLLQAMGMISPQSIVNGVSIDGNKSKL